MILQTLVSIVLGTASVNEPPQKIAHNAECGSSTYYDNWYQGRETTSGALYDRYKVSAASWHFPLGTWLRVTNHHNGRSVVVEVNDRGGYELLDLSEEASIRLSDNGLPDNHSICIEIL